MRATKQKVLIVCSMFFGTLCTLPAVSFASSPPPILNNVFATPYTLAPDAVFVSETITSDGSGGYYFVSDPNGLAQIAQVLTNHSFTQYSFGSCGVGSGSGASVSSLVSSDNLAGSHLSATLTNSLIASMATGGYTSYDCAIYEPSGTTVYGYAQVFVNTATGAFTSTSGGINYGAYWAPLTFATTSDLLSPTSALWNSLTLASTSVQCVSGDWIQNEGCALASYLFEPNPSVMQSFFNNISIFQTKFPFSWMFGLQTAVSGLSASSTANLPIVQMSFSEANFASTTAFGSFMPDVIGLSSSTVMQYFPSSEWNAGQTLISAALWLGLAWTIFSISRSRFHRN